MEPLVSVVIASDRVETLLRDCLLSLEKQAASGGARLEAVVASWEEPSAAPEGVSLRWVRVESRNPAQRRNRAAQAAAGSILAFLDDDATAEPGWLPAGVAALASADIAGRAGSGSRRRAVRRAPVRSAPRDALDRQRDPGP